MRFNLYATFRLIAHTRGAELDLPEGTTVHQAVLALVEHLPVLRPHWLDEKDEIHAHVHIFVDGNDVAALPEGQNTPLKPDSVVDFFPPVGGG